MQTEITLCQQQFQLLRYPVQKNEQHQAWDAADEYLIAHLEGLALGASSHLVIFNDGFGILSCYAAAKGYRVTSISDSFLAQTSAKQNAKQNLTEQQFDNIQFISSLAKLPSQFDLAIMKLPKNNRFLQWQLSQLAASSMPNLTLIAAAKARDIHSSTLGLFEKQLGNTTTSLAKKKARLIFCQKTRQLDQLLPALTTFSVDAFSFTLANHPNVFSGDKLDLAAYLMLQHIPSSDSYKHIIDLGCGNGVLAIQAARQNPQASLTLVDESMMAVESARMNLLAAGISEQRINAVVNNALDGFTPNSADLILCNPPFHQQHTVTDHIAWQMFCDAKRILKPEGQLWVIGNRHLGYHSKIKRLFGNETLVASNAKFTIHKATK